MLKNLFRKIFGGANDEQSTQVTRELVTAPLTPEQIQSASRKTQPGRPPVVGFTESKLEPPQLIVGVGQSVGRQREVNQDSIFAFSSTVSGNTSQIPFGLFIVADGMGGHQHGEVASETSIRVMAEYILSRLYIPLLDPDNASPTDSLQEIMNRGILEAHSAIIKKTPDGGTTMTACLIMGRQMTLAHVGDSRAYYVDADGTLHVLTRDHTIVRRLEEMGQLTSEEAQNHPQRNVLYRALGQGEPVEPEIISKRLPQSGFILICSDGLWGVLSEEQISAILTAELSPHIMCQQLVNLANEAGGPDNISAVLIRVAD